MFRFNKILVVLCLVILSTSVNARRRSRIDVPIKNAADAPLEDNVAQASTAEQQQQPQPQTEAVSPALPVTTLQTETVDDNEVSSSESTSSEELQDCDNIDNISFELVTG